MNAVANQRPLDYSPLKTFSLTREKVLSSMRKRRYNGRDSFCTNYNFLCSLSVNNFFRSLNNRFVFHATIDMPFPHTQKRFYVFFSTLIIITKSTIINFFRNIAALHFIRYLHTIVANLHCKVKQKHF